MKLGRISTPDARLAAVPMLADHIPLPLLADAVDFGAAMQEPWGMLGNAHYGDCVFAAMAHLIQAASANAAGKPREFTDDEVLGWYHDVTGFDPDEPGTDNGAVPLDALKYFSRKGIILGYGRVDPRNAAHVAAAMQLFGGLYTGWDLPTAWQTAEVWDAGPSISGIWAPGSWGGHMMTQVGHDAEMTTPTVTWGRVRDIRRGGWVYCAEAYAVITHEWVRQNGRTLQDFDLSGLLRRLASVA